eukprot:scaffold209349_cov13-Tisochrysis_lutea.AAC.1
MACQASRQAGQRLWLPFHHRNAGCHCSAVDAQTQAQDENEISMREDEELEVQGPEEDGWYPVMRMADGQMGLVPASYIEHKPLF